MTAQTWSLPTELQTGIHSARPATSAVGDGALYSCTTHGLVYQMVAGAWGTWLTLPGGGGTLTTVEEVDGSPTDSAVTKLVFPNGTLAIVGHVATYTPAAGGGSTGARYPVQEKAATAGSQGSAAATLGSTPANGNLLIAVVESEGTTNVSSITQTNVTWTKVAESTASTAPHSEIWKGVVSGSAGTTVTVTWSGTTFCGFMVSEWSGVTGTLDQSAVYTNVSKQYIPTITPTIQTALVISAGAQSTFGAGFGIFLGPALLTFATGVNAYAAAFGFPGTQPVIGEWPNSHGGTFSGVTVSLT